MRPSLPLVLLLALSASEAPPRSTADPDPFVLRAALRERLAERSVLYPCFHTGLPARHAVTESRVRAREGDFLILTAESIGLGSEPPAVPLELLEGEERRGSAVLFDHVGAYYVAALREEVAPGVVQPGCRAVPMGTGSRVAEESEKLVSALRGTWRADTYGEDYGGMVCYSLPKVDGQVKWIQDDLVAIEASGEIDVSAEHPATFEVYKGSVYYGQVRCFARHGDLYLGEVARLNGKLELRPGLEATTRL